MENEVAELALQGIAQISAQEALVSVKTQCYPHVDRKAQEKIHRSLHKQAFPSVYDKPVEITPEQMARLING